ncbi:hypothetical protein ACOSQ2_010228 [Xanthoceras sorbifolium]
MSQTGFGQYPIEIAFDEVLASTLAFLLRHPIHESSTSAASLSFSATHSSLFNPRVDHLHRFPLISSPFLSFVLCLMLCLSRFLSTCISIFSLFLVHHFGFQNFFPIVFFLKKIQI